METCIECGVKRVMCCAGESVLNRDGSVSHIDPVCKGCHSHVHPLPVADEQPKPIVFQPLNWTYI